MAKRPGNHTGGDSGDPGEFDWDLTDTGGLLGAYYLGSVATQLPGGWLTQKFGFKRVRRTFSLIWQTGVS